MTGPTVQGAGRHLEPEELLLLVWDEGGDDGAAWRAHLEACATCRRAAAELDDDLARLGPPPVPEPDPSFEEHLAGRLVWRLAAERRRPAAFRPSWRIAAAAAALVAAVAIGLLIGRDPTPPLSTVTDPVMAASPERVQRAAVREATAEHLARAQVLLIELANGRSGDGSEGDEILHLVVWAEDLLAANRLCRLTAGDTLDAETSRLLSGLEAALVELTNVAPGDSESLALVRNASVRGALLPRLRLARVRLTDPSSELSPRNRHEV